MNFQHLRNHLILLRAPFGPLIILLALAGLLVCLFLAAWWTALALGIAIVFTAITCYRPFLLGLEIGKGFRALKRAQYEEAETALRKALVMVESAPPDDPWRAIVYRDLSAVTRALGTYTDAESFGILSVQTHEKAWGGEDPITLIAMTELAEVYLEIARFDQAQALMERALAAYEKNREAPSLDMALCLNTLGKTWSERENYAKAEPYVRRAWEIMNSHPHATVVNRLFVRAHLADVCTYLGKFDDAESLAQASIDEVQKHFPDNGVARAALLYPLAIVRQEQNRYQEAEKIIRQAMNVSETGKEPPGALSGLLFLALGQNLQSQKKWAESVEWFQKALTIMEDTLPPEHPRIAKTLEAFAGVLERIGQNEQASACKQRARQIREAHSPLRLV